MVKAGSCCLWPCCGRASPGEPGSPVLATKAAALPNGTELRHLPSTHSSDRPLKQEETSMNNCLPSNGHQPRVVREPVPVFERLQTERLQKSAAPAPPAADVTAAAAAEAAPARELLPVDAVIGRRLDKLRNQDPLDVADDTSEGSSGQQRWSVSSQRFAHGFYRGEQQWLSEALHMVERAVQLDELLPVDASVRYSSSVVDLADIMAQVKRIPLESYSNKKDLEKLLTDVCRCCTYYAEEILKRTAYDSDSLEVKQVQHLCVSVSDVEQARAFLVQQLGELELDSAAARCPDLDPAGATALQQRLADTIEHTANTLAALLCARIDFIARKVVCGVRRALLDPQQLGGEREAWLRHMDDTLAVLYARLRPRHLCRLLDAAWDSFRPAVRQAIDDHPYEPASWFRRLQDECEQLVSFVSRADDRTAEEGCPATRVRRELEELLQPYTQDGAQLVHTMRLRRNQQLTASADNAGAGASGVGGGDTAAPDDVLGRLGVRALRAAPDRQGHTQLSVQIMHAANLHPSLSKKIYVKLKFSPKEQFKKVEKCKTEPCKKDIPLFESVFTVRLPPVTEDALLMFVVKKVKKINAKTLTRKKRKRTLAVAYLPLAEVQIGDGPHDPASLERMFITYLPLGQPGKTDPEIVKILERRKQSKKTKKILKKDIRIV